jgi:hypothetical protein
MAQEVETQTDSSNIQIEIEEFKKKVGKCLDKGDIPCRIDEVLSHLRLAEKHANGVGSRRDKGIRRLTHTVLSHLRLAEKYADHCEAWHELAKAKTALRETNYCSAPTNASASVRLLRQELGKLWHELASLNSNEKAVNTTFVADWLKKGEEQLDSEKPQEAEVMFFISRARYSLAKAKESSSCKGIIAGYVAVFCEIIYLVTLPYLIYRYSLFRSTTMSEIVDCPVLQVPCYVFVWGFLGGVSWCIYHAAYWSKRRLFDRSYLPWYVAHPWISAVLGAAVSLLILAGLTGLAFAGADRDVPESLRIWNLPASALLSVTSFAAGFSTHSLWKFLVRTVSNALNVKGGRDLPEEISETVIASAK